MKRSLFIVALLFFLSGLARASDWQIPGGWRIPGPHDIPEKWHSGRFSSFAKVISDFNGDGKNDTAQIAIKAEGEGIGLIVHISKGESYDTIILDQLDGKKWLNIMGVAEVTPGIYKTACGKGYWACKEDEPEEIRLSYSGIDYFMSESANSYYYWNTESKSFKRIWISD